jgi:hypothetical protein
MITAGGIPNPELKFGASDIGIPRGMPGRVTRWGGIRCGMLGRVTRWIADPSLDAGTGDAPGWYSSRDAGTSDALGLYSSRDAGTDTALDC